jgi:Pentapeptide repeats (8 copies)
VAATGGDGPLSTRRADLADVSTVLFALANLTKAYLRAADLTGADLGGANVTGAYLRGANLTKATSVAWTSPGLTSSGRPQGPKILGLECSRFY